MTHATPRSSRLITMTRRLSIGLLLAASLAAPAAADDAARQQLLDKAGAALASGRQKLDIVNGFEPGKVGIEWINGAAEAGRSCGAAVDAALAGGVPADAKVKVVADEVTLADGKQKYCDALIAWSKSYGERSKQAKAEGDAAVREKYAQHGVKGDRLRLFMEYDDVYWRGKGCEIVDDRAALAKAAVLFHWLENSDGTHTIRRYQLKGPKLVKTTNKTYKTEAAAYRGCK